jgi:hypothetical protein
MAGILSPLIIGELVKAADQRSHGIRIMSVATLKYWRDSIASALCRNTGNEKENTGNADADIPAYCLPVPLCLRSGKFDLLNVATTLHLRLGASRLMEEAGLAVVGIDQPMAVILELVGHLLRKHRAPLIRPNHSTNE